MELRTCYVNRKRSQSAEDYLQYSLNNSSLIASNIDFVTAEIIRTPEGNNVVHLNATGHKHFKAFVSGKHDRLYPAMRVAFDKLKGKVRKTKNKVLDRRRKFDDRSSLSPQLPGEQSIDAEDILKFEKGVQRNKLRLIQDNESCLEIQN